MAILWQTSDPIATSDFSIGTGLVQNTGNVELSPANGAASGRDGSATSENVRYGYIRFRFDDLPENRVEFFGYGYGYQRTYLTIDQNGSVDVRGHNVGDIDTGIMTVTEGVTYDVEMYFNLDTDEYEVRNGGSNISSGSQTQGGSLREFFVGNDSLLGSLDTTVTYDLKVFEVVIDDSDFPFAAGPSMTGAVDVDLSVAGDMLVSEPMTGPVTIDIDVSGAMFVPEPMSGSVEIEVDVAGAMVIAPVMEGSIEIELSTEGELLVPEPMTGDAAVQLDVSGEMLVLVPMSGDIEVKLNVDGSMEALMSGEVGIGVGVSGAMVAPTEIPIPSTVISQYANSPRLVRLIKNVAEYIDPATNFDDFYDYVWNVDTAQGFGLDIWGKIVGVSREIEIDIEDDPFGFETGLSDYQPFNQGTFYTGETFIATYKLDDDAFRLLILTKALANITDCSVPSINRLLQNLFADRGRCYVNDLGNMLIRYTFEFVPEPHELSIITKSGVFPHPSGVRVFMIIAPEAFGFQEAGDHDVFNAGTDPQTSEYSGSPFFNQENLYAI